MSRPAPDPLPSAPAEPHAIPDDKEEIYFEGSPPLRAVAGKLLLYLLIAAAMIALGGWLIYAKLGPWWIGAILIVFALGVPLIPWLMTKRVRYRITNYRIDFERGLLSKNIDTLELWHVEDLRFHQSLLSRIMDVGTITVIAHDETMPRLQLLGIPKPRPIFEMLKQRVIAVKRQRGVIKMDNG
jgi:membrane protein YdbS with pleckstrin-like domain